MLLGGVMGGVCTSEATLSFDSLCLIACGGMQCMIKIPFIFVTFEDFGDMLTKKKETELGAI